MDPNDKPTAKILFRVPYEDETAEVETLWAFDLGQDRYRLANSPFYAYSVSWEDVVYAPYSLEEQRPTFQRVVEKSGRKTVRVRFAVPMRIGDASHNMLQGLVSLGCSYENADSTLVSVDVPPDVRLEAVREFLINENATWEHADPTYDELFPDAA
jgi:hypothetical protein